MSTTANPADEHARSIHERHAALFPNSRHNTETGESEGGRSSGGGGGMTLDMAQKANKGDQEPVRSAQAPALKPSTSAPQEEVQKAEVKPAPQQDQPQKASTTQDLPNINAIRIPPDIHEWRAHKAELAAAAKAKSSEQSQSQNQAQTDVDVDVDKPRPRTMR